MPSCTQTRRSRPLETCFAGTGPLRTTGGVSLLRSNFLKQLKESKVLETKSKQKNFSNFELRNRNETKIYSFSSKTKVLSDLD